LFSLAALSTPTPRALTALVTVVEDAEMESPLETPGECVGIDSQKEYLLHLDGSRHLNKRKLITGNLFSKEKKL
jgi:hypothetical protein